jgi:hypothetical protein
MEMLPGNFLCSYLKQTKMSAFSFTNSENRRTEQVLPVQVGEERRWGKGVEG